MQTLEQQVVLNQRIFATFEQLYQLVNEQNSVMVAQSQLINNLLERVDYLERGI